MQQLKRLIFLYRQRFEDTHLTMLITPGLLYLLNDIFRHSDSPEAQFYFVWSIRGFLAIAPWSPGLVGIAKALFSLGRRVGVFQKQAWAGSLLESTQRAVAALEEDGVYRSLYPINVGLTGEGNDAEITNMEELAYEFQEQDRRSRDGSSAVGEEAKDVWRGDPMDLDLTLSEAIAPDDNT